MNWHHPSQRTIHWQRAVGPAWPKLRAKVYVGVITSVLAIILVGCAAYLRDPQQSRSLKLTDTAPVLPDSIDWMSLPTRPPYPSQKLASQPTTLSPQRSQQAFATAVSAEASVIELATASPSLTRSHVSQPITVTTVVKALDSSLSPTLTPVAEPPISIRCVTSNTWALPLRHSQMKVSARYGYFDSKSTYFKTLTGVGGLKEDAQGVFHPGMDYRTGMYAPVYGVADAVVEFVGFSEQYGLHIVMRLTDTAVGDAVRVLYGHLADSFTNTGQTVRCGQIVGLMGNSGKAIKGAHLHFEVRLNDRAVDPAAYLERALQAEPPEWYTEGRKQ